VVVVVAHAVVVMAHCPIVVDPSQKLRVATVEDEQPGFHELFPRLGDEIQCLVCIAHWLKIEIDGTAAAGPVADQFVKDLSHSLFSGEEVGARRVRLTVFVHEHRSGLKGSRLGQVEADIQMMKTALESGHLEPGNRTAVMGKLLKAHPKEMSVATLQEAVHRFVHDDDHWKEQGTVLLHALQQLGAEIRKFSCGAGTATTNQTRWHSSCFASFTFVNDNLNNIHMFYEAEAGRVSPSCVCPSIKSILATLGDSDKKTQLSVELTAYVSSMKPAADFLKVASEPTQGLSMNMFGLLVTCVVGLCGMKLDSPGWRLGAALAPRVLFRYNANLDPKAIHSDTAGRVRTTLHVFFTIHLLKPGVFFSLGMAPAESTRAFWEHAHANGALHVENVRKFLNVSDDELPAAEWEAWVEKQRTWVIPPSPMDFWLKEASFAFPKLRLIAAYLMAMPAVVTTCDSVISVTDDLFSTKQGALSDIKASAIVALRCNGDVSGTLGRGIRSAWMPMTWQMHEA
jgi:hypothetical protein